MRIIFISTRSWAWQGVEKLNSRMASLRVLGEAGANALTPPEQIFRFRYARIFSLSKQFPQQHYYISQQIFQIKSPSKSQYKIVAKIIIHHSPKNVKRGGANRKNGGLQGWLEMSIPLTRNWRSFSGFVVIHRMPFCQHLTKSHFRISPSTGLSLVVEYITIQWQYIGNSQNFTIALYQQNYSI